MPAVSKKQQEFMAIAEHAPSKLQGKMPNMTHDQLHDFAATPHAGLPEAVHVNAPKAPKAPKSTDSLHSQFSMREGAHSSHPGLSHKQGPTVDSLHPKMGYK